MASPMVRVRLDERLHARVLEAAAAEARDLSGWIREAIMERLGAVEREAAERAELLAEARRFLANPGATEVDRTAAGLVERYVAAIEAQAGRLSVAEQRGRARALAEIADGALEAIDGAEVEVVPLPAAALPVVLETTTPRRRGFLREELARERARALLEAPTPMLPPPSAAGLLGEARTRELFEQALRWPGVRSVYCPTHGITPCAPGSDGARCYLSCSIPTASDSPEVA